MFVRYAEHLVIAVSLFGCRPHPTRDVPDAAPTSDARASHATVAAEDSGLPTPTHATDPAPREADACAGVGNPLGLTLPPGFCLAPIVTGLAGARQMVVSTDGDLVVAESGPGWRAHLGGVSIVHRESNGTFTTRRVLTRLDRPHGIALHSGWLYVAEASRISRVRYPVPEGASVETVVADLPTRGRHNHKTLAFGPDGRLYFSVGSATDNCAAVSSPPLGEEPCAEAEGLEPSAVPDASVLPMAVQRAAIRRWDPRRGRVETFARGLRNTLGFAWHPASGRMFGVENARDAIQLVDHSLSDSVLPHDELNEIVSGARYGWPYCYDAARASPEYPTHGDACRHRERSPALLLPPHAAPMSIVFYQGSMFPERFRGRAIVTYHGYRNTGHRVVSIPFDSRGNVTGEPEDLVSDWGRRPDRPHGHLMGLAVANDGSLFVSDDVVGTIYRLAFGSAAAAVPHSSPVPEPAIDDAAQQDVRCRAIAESTDPFARIQRTTIDVRCVQCHAAGAGGLVLRMCDAHENAVTLTRATSSVYGPYVIPGRVDAGYLLGRLHGDTMGPQMPFQNVPLPQAEMAAIEAWIRDGASVVP